MRVFHIAADQFSELDDLPAELPARGYLWVGCTRSEFGTRVADLQNALQRWVGGQLVDLHVSDLLNRHLPSHFDYTSWYDLMAFRRLLPTPTDGDAATGRLPAIDTSPIGFAVFDRVLLTVHPDDCVVREFFAQRLAQQVRGGESRAVRLPTSPADLMLRMLNHLVDSYLELRRLLTRQFGELQQQLFRPGGRFDHWQMLLESRNTLHLLEDTCEDQRAAVQEWVDALAEWPAESDPQAARERELLSVRSRDVQEHIERVLAHVRRLESSSEAAVQMHFSAQANRTNDIMRTLTVLTAIFLPLNLITGFFGMNFEALPLIHNPLGFWLTFGAMVVIGIGFVVYFRAKRYLGARR
ncbi:MAG: magnesium transporter CorA family protein [Betaproteobacteria bacterium]